MPFILADEPTGEVMKGGFDVLDSAFGTAEFERDQALTALANGLELEQDNAVALFQSLVDGGFVAEV